LVGWNNRPTSLYGEIILIFLISFPILFMKASINSTIWIVFSVYFIICCVCLFCPFFYKSVSYRIFNIIH
jgi:hypothetical protein